jgi:hypothetical protein
MQSSSLIKNPGTGKNINACGKTAIKLLNDHQNKIIRLPQKTVKSIKAALKRKQRGGTINLIQSHRINLIEDIDKKDIQNLTIKEINEMVLKINGVGFVYAKKVLDVKLRMDLFYKLPLELQIVIRDKYLDNIDDFIKILPIENQDQILAKYIKNQEDLKYLRRLRPLSKGTEVLAKAQNNVIINSYTIQNFIDVFSGYLTMNDSHGHPVMNIILDTIRQRDFEADFEAEFEALDNVTGQILSFDKATFLNNLRHHIGVHAENLKKWENLWTISMIEFYFKYQLGLSSEGLDWIQQKVYNFLSEFLYDPEDPNIQDHNAEVEASKNEFKRCKNYFNNPNLTTIGSVVRYFDQMPLLCKAIIGY